METTMGSTIPLLTINEEDIPMERAEVQNKLNRKELKKRKREEREAKVLREVLARAEETKLYSESEPQRSAPKPKAPPKPHSLIKIPSETLDKTVPLTLYISNLGPAVKRCHVESWCLDAVEKTDINEIRLVEDQGNKGKHRAFGFIELINSEASARVLDLDGTELLGSEVSVRPARPKKGHQEETAGGRGTRRFGSLDYSALALGVEKRHKQLIAEQVASSEKARAAYLQKKEKEEQVARDFVAAGGKLPDGFGYGYTANGRPKLHNGYSSFDV